MAVPQKQEIEKAPPRPLRIVKPSERKPDNNAKVELLKVRRELLTLASRIEIVIKGQD